MNGPTGRRIEDGHKLSEYDIHDGDRHHMVVSLPTALSYLAVGIGLIAATIVPFIMHCILIANLNPIKDKNYFLSVRFSKKPAIKESDYIIISS